MNNCYASIEMFHNPKLRGVPLAVGGDAEERHGIILARSYETRPYGIKVGMALWQARQLCPGLVIVPPNYPLYLRYSRMLRKILCDYSDQVEPFGLDESWVDVTSFLGRGLRSPSQPPPRAGTSTPTYNISESADVPWWIRGQAIANEIRQRVKDEMGVTVSVGVSFNKIFAKLGSDLKKPDATTVITRENFRDVVWPLAASELLGVGRRTMSKLMTYQILTIGDLAMCDPIILQRRLGKWGLFLHTYANGWDVSPVARAGDSDEYAGIIKTVGNSTTCPRDLENENDCMIVFTNLAESVSERMRELGMMARTVEISLRTNDLFWCTRQMKLKQATHITPELTAAAMQLLRANYGAGMERSTIYSGAAGTESPLLLEKPLRSIGIRGCDLVPINADRQMSLFEDERRRERAEQLEYAVDDIRRRFGHTAITRALLHTDARLGRLNPKEDHVIHPIGYLG
jgi:DNA polymerase-4